MKPVNPRVILFLFALILAFGIRCTPEKRFHILNMLFDGVPDTTKKTAVIVASNDSSDVALVMAPRNKAEGSLHKPYGENQCSSCHEGGYSNRLLEPLPTLCYRCHENFNDKYKTVHGPVVSGNCLACHNQHESKYDKLLLRKGQELCLFCHQAKQILKNSKHKKIGGTECTQCHNPHGGDNRGMLKKETCYNCHDNFNSKYNFLHGPVVSGNCTACHGAHSLDKPKHLLRESQKICAFCHDLNRVFKNPAHKNNKSDDCLKCHNPHGGEDRYILIEAIRPYITKPLSPAKTESKDSTIHPANTETKKQGSTNGKTDSIDVKGPAKTNPVSADTIKTSATDKNEKKSDQSKKVKVDSVQGSNGKEKELHDAPDQEKKALPEGRTKEGTDTENKNKENTENKIEPIAPVKDSIAPQSDTIRVNWSKPK